MATMMSNAVARGLMNQMQAQSQANYQKLAQLQAQALGMYLPQTGLAGQPLGGVTVAGTSTTYGTTSDPRMMDKYWGVGSKLKTGGIPEIDKKLSRLYQMANRGAKGDVNYWFTNVLPEDAVSVLGNYNPLYNGRPKKLAQLMLDAVAGPAPMKHPLWHCGLFYIIPENLGVRKRRYHLSLAGLRVLEHWAAKFPKFGKFFEAYRNDKMVERITCDCFDFTMGSVPKWMRDEIKLNETERKVRWEAAQWRKYQREEVKRLARQAEEQRKLRELERQQQNALSQINRQPIWTTSPLNNAAISADAGKDLTFRDSSATISLKEIVELKDQVNQLSKSRTLAQKAREALGWKK